MLKFKKCNAQYVTKPAQFVGDILNKNKSMAMGRQRSVASALEAHRPQIAHARRDV